MLNCHINDSFYSCTDKHVNQLIQHICMLIEVKKNKKMQDNVKKFYFNYYKKVILSSPFKR